MLAQVQIAELPYFQGSTRQLAFALFKYGCGLVLTAPGRRRGRQRVRVLRDPLAGAYGQMGVSAINKVLVNLKMLFVCAGR